ncbi:alpha/beta hydrolase [Amycolatopsis marina]|uniref:alpha/beta hydrolase n=1 Tax=Amycolatopsis marina TaxID=490629 RepID=UPI000B842289|nr:hypothetical protein [Amycolatopsis marina]
MGDSADATGSAPERPGSYREVTFPAQDGATRSGRLFGDGSVAVVLSYMGRSGDSQDDWKTFAESLAEHGYQALTYAREADSEQNDFVDHWRDVLGAATFLRDHGAETVIAGGASIGAVASLHAAEQPDNGINAVLWLAGLHETDSYEFSKADVARISCPIMFVSGEGDAYGSAESARLLHDWAPTSELLFIESYRHGTDILTHDETSARTLSQAMLEFVKRMEDQDATC